MDPEAPGRETHLASDRPKVVGVGLNKTGTTTLAQCGRIFGYRTSGYDRELLREVKKGDLTRVWEVFDEFDFFEDWPWPLLYREIDERHPGTKFVLTTRSSPETWLSSLDQHSLRSSPLKHCRRLAYGHAYPKGREAEYLETYERHNAGVREHFADREDLLEICWEQGDGLEKLGRFLGQPGSDAAVPHANRAADKRPRPFTVLSNRLLRAIQR